ncbi:MAG TPA: zinc ribbon domain-containing protein [Candidatus Binataceae bacterium]|nr:zinc ribbon domain-containing protein [Candidatus Binataceae bacterium]
MPIYEYRCRDCDRGFEALVRAGRRDRPECPACHGTRVKREMSVFAARVGNGNGAGASEQAFGEGAGASAGGCCGACGGACACH